MSPAASAWEGRLKLAAAALGALAALVGALFVVRPDLQPSSSDGPASPAPGGAKVSILHKERRPEAISRHEYLRRLAVVAPDSQPETELDRVRGAVFPVSYVLPGFKSKEVQVGWSLLDRDCVARLDSSQLIAGRERLIPSTATTPSGRVGVWVPVSGQPPGAYCVQVCLFPPGKDIIHQDERVFRLRAADLKGGPVTPSDHPDEPPVGSWAGPLAGLGTEPPVGPVPEPPDRQ